MQKERISDDIYVFTSELYAQVTAGAVVGADGTALIDTLPFPSETRQIRDFVEKRLGSRVRYVINTSPEPDHAGGNEGGGEEGHERRLPAEQFQRRVSRGIVTCRNRGIA